MLSLAGCPTNISRPHQQKQQQAVLRDLQSGEPYRDPSPKTQRSPFTSNLTRRNAHHHHQPKIFKMPEVTLDTTMGTLTLELYPLSAPRTCTNFLTLSQRGYYNNILFHRIIPTFMLQSGDPTGTGRGGTSIYTPSHFADEIDPTLKHTGAGILSMANSGPDTNGSQFFITLAPTPWLDGKHTIFGRVKSGMGVVKRMGLVQTDGEDRPVEEVKIIRARVVEDEAEDGA